MSSGVGQERFSYHCSSRGGQGLLQKLDMAAEASVAAAAARESMHEQ